MICQFSLINNSKSYVMFLRNSRRISCSVSRISTCMQRVCHDLLDTLCIGRFSRRRRRRKLHLLGGASRITRRWRRGLAGCASHCINEHHHHPCHGGKPGPITRGFCTRPDSARVISMFGLAVLRDKPIRFDLIWILRLYEWHRRLVGIRHGENSFEVARLSRSAVPQYLIGRVLRRTRVFIQSRSRALPLSPPSQSPPHYHRHSTLSCSMPVA